MHYNFKAVPHTLLGKTCVKYALVVLHEAKGDPLEKENQIKNRSVFFAAYKQFVWWIYQRLGKGNRSSPIMCFVEN